MELSSAHTSRKKIRTDYSNDLKYFAIWVLQKYYKFCFRSKACCNVDHDLSATILWEMAMILSSDKLNWSQGIGRWLINLQPDPENILYDILFLLETHVTPLSVNTTSCLVYLNYLFGSDFILVTINTYLSMTIALDKDTKEYYFVLFSMQCSTLFLISPCKNWQVFYHCILCSFLYHEREYYVFIRLPEIHLKICHFTTVHQNTWALLLRPERIRQCV